MKKSLKALRINDGLNIFIEDDRVTYPKLDELGFMTVAEGTCKWQIEFELDRTRYTIRYNEPTEELADDHPDER